VSESIGSSSGIHLTNTKIYNLNIYIWGCHSGLFS